MHYNKNMENKREHGSKTEMVGDRNTRKAKTTRVSQHRMLDYEICFRFLFKKVASGIVHRSTRLHYH